MTTSKEITPIDVYLSLRRIGEDALLRKQWEVARCCSHSQLRLWEERLDEAKRAVHGDGAAD
jgi:hypothetical protein